MLRIYFIVFLIIGAGLEACSSYNTIKVNDKIIVVDVKTNTSGKIDSIISPYRTDLEKEMNEIIAQANVNFIPGRPCGNLNNWTADAMFQSQFMTQKFDAPVMCLLNTGGIRSTINKGNVTMGDLFKVMPFDNVIIVVKMPVSTIPKIEAYIKKTGGEPISGAKVQNGKLLINGLDEKASHFWIVTSDYLFNGGDNMTFFKDNSEFYSTGQLMRNVIINYAREQKTLVNDSISRIQL